MLAKLLAAGALIVLFSAFATLGVVYYQESTDQSGSAPTPCSHKAPATDDEPDCCKTVTDDHVMPAASCCDGAKLAK